MGLNPLHPSGMRIGVITRRSLPMSIRTYRDSIIEHLRDRNVTFIVLNGRADRTGDLDLIWDPTLAGARTPVTMLKWIDRPVVATVHGAGAFTIPLRERWSGLAPMGIQWLRKRRTLSQWTWFAKTVKAVIAVSDYGAGEVADVFGVESDRITTIYHGIDHNVFHPADRDGGAERPYLLHVSAYRPKKNLPRILAAYEQLGADRPDLIAVVPGYRGPAPAEGVKIVREPKTSDELAVLYRRALGFVFPSLHETFGLPIVEAMACGCPVITANTTACAEVAGDAAITVDPRRVEDISQAMRQVAAEPELRERLRAKGLERAMHFTWQRSADEHLQVFRRCAGSAPGGAS